jgi:hypothetical protein
MATKRRSENVKRVIRTQNKNHDALKALPNVVGTATGLRQRKGRYTNEICVQVFVSQKVPLEDLPKPAIIPRQVVGTRGEKTRTDVIEVGPFRLLEDPNRYRPIPGGCSFGNANISAAAGTLGGWACDSSDNSIVALTCNHVVTSPYDRTHIPDGLASEVAQPGLDDAPDVEGNLVGSIKRIVPILTFPNSEIPPPITSVDAAICSVGDQIDLDVLNIAPAIYETAQPSSCVGDMVQKRGRTSELTTNGQITSVNVIGGSIDYGSRGGAPPAYATIGPCFAISSTDGQPFIQGGDSGSLVFLQQEGMVQGTFPVVGVVFSTNGITTNASDITLVFELLGLETVCQGLFNWVISTI